ncbi:hypothetical protein [Halomonas binhaiensis]|uniref:Endonuclease/exonuclease/phosphatase domain-containing protein n=1 Tax=Halomonas binhaiensis TaxID=2562282 RepID=A0A5C1NEW7_9GAMM|nr:hypothetical protein [Halomonas binhaiensis]QEM82262.1 hypothetical protein E4T21_12435 [Halomonas binhaiensis]
MRVNNADMGRYSGDLNKGESDFLRALENAKSRLGDKLNDKSSPPSLGPMLPPMLPPRGNPLPFPSPDDLPIPDEPKDSTSYSVGSFNTYGASNIDGEKNSGLEYLKELVSDTDIVGFQETGGSDGAKVTGAMIESGMNGYVPGENPIYWDKDKFDLVYSETLVFHEPDERGPGVKDDEATTDQTRTSTIVILRDKETGNEILVTNAHTDNNYDGKDLGPSRDAQLEQLANRQDELMEEFSGIQATVNLGDFNQRDSGRLDDGADIHNNPSDSAADHIIVDGENGGEITAGEADNRDHPDNGDFYDHRPLLHSFTLEGNQSDEEKAAAKEDEIVDKNGRGAVFYQNTSYNEKNGGDAWVIGFGSDVNQQPDWNDRVSSVRISDGMEVELFDDVGHDDDGNVELSGDSLDITGDTANVGDDMNDKTSGYRLRWW